MCCTAASDGWGWRLPLPMLSETDERLSRPFSESAAAAEPPSKTAGGVARLRDFCSVFRGSALLPPPPSRCWCCCMVCMPLPDCLLSSLTVRSNRGGHAPPPSFVLALTEPLLLLPLFRPFWWLLLLIAPASADCCWSSEAAG